MDFFPHAIQHPILRLEEEQRTWFAALFTRLVQESRQSDPYQIGCMVSLLELVVAEVARQYEGAPVRSGQVRYEQPDISRLVKNVIQYINHNFREDITLSKIAREFWLNPSYLSRQFKVNVGINITEFITSRRLNYAKFQLVTTEKTISEIALNAGFNNISYFNTVFKGQVGMSPRQYRREQRLGTISENDYLPFWEGW